MAVDEQIGRRLRRRRQELNFSIRELARRSGLSASFISQVERGKANLSLESLRQIAECLEISMMYFLSESEISRSLSGEIQPCEEADESLDDYFPVVRAGCRPKLIFPTSGVSYELLTNDLNRKMEPVLGRLSPGTGNVARRLRKPTEELIFVLSGSLLIGLDEKEYVLNPGDSIYFEGEALQKIACASQSEDVVWVSVITPPVF